MPGLQLLRILSYSEKTNRGRGKINPTQIRVKYINKNLLLLKDKTSGIG